MKNANLNQQMNEYLLTLIKEHTRHARSPLKSFGIVSKDILITILFNLYLACKQPIFFCVQCRIFSKVFSQIESIKY